MTPVFAMAWCNFNLRHPGVDKLSQEKDLLYYINLHPNHHALGQPVS